MLPNGTKLQIDDALHYSRSNRNLINFKDICQNRYHIETSSEGNSEFLSITSTVSCHKHLLEKLHFLSFGLYHKNIRTIYIYFTMNQKFSDSKIFKLWHDRLGHPGSIMICGIIKNSHGHQLKNQKILLPTESPCATCSQGKLIIRPSPMKVSFESPKFLERIQ